MANKRVNTTAKIINGSGLSKSFDLDGMTAEQWNQLFPEMAASTSGNSITAREAYKQVSWVNRGVVLRSGAVASMPFSILRGDKVVDSSRDYKNVVKFLPNPARVFGLVEAALTLLGRAYLFRVTNMIGSKTQSLRHFNPTTIKPIIDKEFGLVGYERTLGGGIMQMPVESIVNFWALDPYIELGPPDSSPVRAGLSAAGVLMNVDAFAAAYFERGAIKTTLLTVSGYPEDEEIEKLQNWFSRVMSGIGAAWKNAVIDADAVTPVVIGEGIESLSNTSLTQEKREDIATAIGIPHSMLFSSAANYAVAEQDNKNFYETTVIPEAVFIAYALNEQVFKPAGYKLRFDEQALSIFQEDEKERSTAFMNYTNAGMPPGMAAEILGIKLPDGMEYADLNAAAAEMQALARERVQEQRVRPAPVADDKTRADLDNWHRRTIMLHQKGKPLNHREFESDYINPVLSAAIVGSLKNVTNEDDIARVFYDAFTWRQYP